MVLNYGPASPGTPTGTPPPSGVFLYPNMKYTTHIDNRFAIRHGLTLAEAAVLDWMFSLPRWADRVLTDGKVFYFASKNKACEELPLVTTKVDTMYRHYRTLSSKGLIEIVKVGSKDYICFCEAVSGWDRTGGESEHSEKFPTKLGKISDPDSEKFPTDKYISNKTTSDKKEPPTPFQGEDCFDPPQQQKKSGAKGARGAAARAAMVFGVLDDMGLDGASRDLVERWVNYREDAGKPYKTQEGVRMMVNKIRKLSGGSYARAVEIVEESIANEWTGLFELKPKSSKNGKDETAEQRFERNAAIVAEVFRDRAARE